MSGKNILKNNRVFLATDKNNYIQSIVERDFRGTDLRLYVANTNDFTDSGKLIINENGGYIRYSSKHYNYFNIVPSNIMGLICRQGDVIKQKCISTNNNNAGWYVNNNNTNATLKVGNANIITPGAIRFIEGNTEKSGYFQGCVKVTENNAEWVNFNALEGPPGKDGNINTSLNYETIGSGEGKIFLDDNTDVTNNNSSVKIRSITADKKIINGQLNNNIIVKTKDNDVLIGLEDIGEVVYDLTGEINDIKGNPEVDEMLNCYGEQIRVRVCTGKTVKKGQVVTISMFKDKEKNGKMYYGVSAFNISENGEELLKYKLGNSKYSFGLCRMDGSDGEIVKILVRGIGLLRMGNNIAGMNTISTVENLYLGYPVLLDRDGYGFMCRDIGKLPDPHMELGRLLESGSNIGCVGNYVLIQFNPLIVDL
jgi:hypothetical protein